MRDLKVLIGCEESQTVCKAFRAKGHEAYSCDLQECSGGHPEWHFNMDIFQVINGGELTTQSGNEVHIDKWDLGIFHPPCTFISKAGACRMYPTAGNVSKDRLILALEAKDFFMRLLNCCIDKIAVENPLPLKIVGLPKPTTYVQPYEHGHAYSKKTLLWLKGLPSIMPTIMVAEYKPYLPSNTGGKKRGQKYMFKTISQKERSKTFPGIAQAMADQWG